MKTIDKKIRCLAMVGMLVATAGAEIPVLMPGETLTLSTVGMQTPTNTFVNCHLFAYLRELPAAMAVLHTNEIRYSTHPFWNSLQLLKPQTGPRMPDVLHLDTTGFPPGDYQVIAIMAEQPKGANCVYKSRTFRFAVRTPAARAIVPEGDRLPHALGFRGDPDGVATAAVPWRAAVPCRWKAFHDNDWLYVAIADVGPSGVTVSLDVDGRRLSIFQIHVDAAGNLSDARFDDDNTGTGRYVRSSLWRSGARAKVRETDEAGGKTVELALPLGALGVSREDADDRPLMLCLGDWHKPSAFVPLHLARAATIRHAWTLALERTAVSHPAGQNVCAIRLGVTNGNAEFRAGKTRLRVLDADGKAHAQVLAEVGAVPKKPAVVDVAVTNVPNGTYTLALELLSPEGALEAQIYRNVRLVHEPVSIRLTAPAYRDCVFETMKLDRIAGMVVVTEEMIGRPLDIRLTGPGTDERQTIAAAAETNRFEFPFVARAKGDYTLAVGGVSRRIRNLPYRKGEVWFDRTGVMYRDGVKTFPIGWFSDYFRYMHPGVNITQSYWNQMKSVADEGKMRDLIRRAAANGCGYIVTPFQPLPDVDRAALFGPRLTSSEFGIGPQGEQQRQAVRRMVETVQDEPGFLAYYLADEPEGWNTSPRFLAQAHDFLQEIDPYHPTIVVNFSEEGVATFHESGDVMAPDAYPTYFLDGTTRDAKRRNYAKARIASSFGPAWECPQVFDWDIAMEGRPASRGPTYDEIREQCLLAVAGDARGLLFYGRAQCASIDWHLWLGSEAVIDELLEAKDAFLAPSIPVSVTSPSGASSDLVAAVKRFGDETLLIVVNCAQRATRATLASSALPAVLHLADSAVPVKISEGRLAVELAAYESRVYRSRPWRFSPAKIRAEIARRETARRKPGNLAAPERFLTLLEQKRIREGKMDYPFPRLVASSSQNLSNRPHVSPYFLQDGFDQPLPYVPYQAWAPRGDDASPWVRVEFGGRRRFSRVRLVRCRDEKGVYAFDSGRLMVDGTERAAFAAATNAVVELTFPAVESEAVTLLPGPCRSRSSAYLVEFEVYEK